MSSHDRVGIRSFEIAWFVGIWAAAATAAPPTVAFDGGSDPQLAIATQWFSIVVGATDADGDLTAVTYEIGAGGVTIIAGAMTASAAAGSKYVGHSKPSAAISEADGGYLTVRATDATGNLTTITRQLIVLPYPELAAVTITPSQPFGDEPIVLAVALANPAADVEALVWTSNTSPLPFEINDYPICTSVPLAWNDTTQRFEGTIAPAGRAVAASVELLVKPHPSLNTVYLDDVATFLVSYARPSIASVTPEHGPLQSAGQVSLLGHGFLYDVDTGEIEVTFGTQAVPASDIVIVNDHEVRVVPPSVIAAGPVSVSVSVPKWGEVLTATAPEDYVYSGGIFIDAYSPHGMPEKKPFEVRLLGSGFQSAPNPQVSLGDSTAQQVVIESDSSLRAYFGPLTAADDPMALAFTVDGDSAVLADAFRVSQSGFRILQTHTLWNASEVVSIAQLGSRFTETGATSVLARTAAGASTITSVQASSIQGLWGLLDGTLVAEGPGVHPPSAMLAFRSVVTADDYYDGYGTDYPWLLGVPSAPINDWEEFPYGGVGRIGEWYSSLGLPGDRLGQSLTGIVDIDRDGLFEIAAAGAPGARRVELVHPDSWYAPVDFLTSIIGGGPADEFGAALGAGRDAAGIHYLAIGGPAASPLGHPHSGSVWLYRIDASASPYDEPAASAQYVTRIDFTEPEGTVGPDGLAMGLAVLPDLDANGAVEIAVGLPGTQNRRGSVRVIDAATKIEKWRVDGLHPDDHLGAALQLASDCDADGIPELVANAIGDDSGGYDAGAVFLLSGIDGSALERFTGTTGSALGSAFLSSPDIDQDGFAEVVVASREGDSAMRITRFGRDPRAETALAFPGGGILDGTLSDNEDRDGLSIVLHAGEEIVATFEPSSGDWSDYSFLAVDDAGDVLASNLGFPCHPAEEFALDCYEQLGIGADGLALRVRAQELGIVHFIVRRALGDSPTSYDLRTKRTKGKTLKEKGVVNAPHGEWAEFAFEAESQMGAAIDLEWLDGHVDALAIFAPDGTDLLAENPSLLKIAKPKGTSKNAQPTRATIGPNSLKPYAPSLKLVDPGTYRIAIRGADDAAAKVKLKIVLRRNTGWPGYIDQD